MKLLIPLAGLIDKDEELKRLAKEIEKLEKELGRIEGKLNNEKFVSKAPEAVVEKEKAKAADARAALENLQEQQEKIAKL